VPCMDLGAWAPAQAGPGGGVRNRREERPKPHYRRVLCPPARLTASAPGAASTGSLCVTWACGSSGVSSVRAPRFPREADLSTELGVSRTVVREAIKVLAAKGHVESRPRTGTRALGRGYWRLVDPEVLAWQMEAGPDPGFLADLVEVRDIIEPRAAEAAAERATLDERAALLRLQDEMEASAADPAAAMRIDLALHVGIVRAAHNGLLAQLTGR